MAQRRVPLTVSLPPELARKFEKLAKIEEKNKSQLFRDMFRAYEQRRLEQEFFELQRYGARKARKKGILTEKGVEGIVRHRPQKRPIDNPSVRKAFEYIIQHPFRWSAKSGSTQAIRKRRYSDSAITQFLKEDRLDRKTAKKVIRRLRLPNKARKRYQADPLAKRRGSFDGPADLSQRHDHYLGISSKRPRQWLGDHARKELEHPTEESYRSLSKTESKEDRQWSKISARSAKRLWDK